MSSIAGHLARRGAEFASVHFTSNNPETQPRQMSGTLVALLAVTISVFGLAVWAVSHPA